jgi:hypothetical protein
LEGRAERHAECNCHPKVTPQEYLAAIEIEAGGRHKKKPSAGKQQIPGGEEFMTSLVT